MRPDWHNSTDESDHVHLLENYLQKNRVSKMVNNLKKVSFRNMESAKLSKSKNILDADHILAWLSNVEKINDPMAFHSYLKQIEDKKYWFLKQESEKFRWVKELVESLENIKDEILLSPEKYLGILCVLSSINCGPSLFILNQLNKKSHRLFEGLIRASQKKDIHKIEIEAKVLIGRIKLLARREYFLHVFSKENRQWTNYFLRKIKETGDI